MNAANLNVQIRILYRRATVLRASIILAVASILLASLLVADIFVAGVFGISVRTYSIGLFAASFLALMASLVLFIEDVGLSLKALRLELGLHIGRPAPPARREQTGFVSRSERKRPEPTPASATPPDR